MSSQACFVAKDSYVQFLPSHCVALFATPSAYSLNSFVAVVAVATSQKYPTLDHQYAHKCCVAYVLKTAFGEIFADPA